MSRAATPIMSVMRMVDASVDNMRFFFSGLPYNSIAHRCNQRPTGVSLTVGVHNLRISSRLGSPRRTP